MLKGVSNILSTPVYIHEGYSILKNIVTLVQTGVPNKLITQSIHSICSVKTHNLNILYIVICDV